MKESGQVSFRERFCKTFGTSEEFFEREALRWFLHSPWGSLANVIMALKEEAFQVDREILSRIGKMDDFSQLAREIRDIRLDYQRARDFGFSRRYLRRRLSSERILMAAKEFWSQG